MFTQQHKILYCGRLVFKSFTNKFDILEHRCTRPARNYGQEYFDRRSGLLVGPALLAVGPAVFLGGGPSIVNIQPPVPSMPYESSWKILYVLESADEVYKKVEFYKQELYSRRLIIDSI